MWHRPNHDACQARFPTSNADESVTVPSEALEGRRLLELVAAWTSTSSLSTGSRWPQSFTHTARRQRRGSDGTARTWDSLFVVDNSFTLSSSDPLTGSSLLFPFTLFVLFVLPVWAASCRHGANAALGRRFRIVGFALTWPICVLT